MIGPRMASSSTPSGHTRRRLSRQRLEAEVALGRTARGDGIVWTAWGSQATRSRSVSCMEVDQKGTLAVQEREDHRLVNVSLQWSLQRRAAPSPSYACGAGFADPANLRLYCGS